MARFEEGVAEGIALLDTSGGQAGVEEVVVPS